MKKASDILLGIKPTATIGILSIPISGLSIDSRQVKAGGAFFAYQGLSSDGHQFIQSAIQNGATLIVCEKLPESINEQVTYVQVENCKKVIGIAAANFYNHPSQKINLVGVTGTNGKTTVATLSYQLFKGLGYKTGLLSTIQNIIDEEKFPATHTTSDAIAINAMLNLMVERGCQYAFMECSSHAIDQDRIYGLHFKIAVFTNITRDHLDYHKTFDNYIKAKKKLFDQLDKDAFALVNVDDKRGEVMLQNCKAKHLTFALKNLSDFHAKILESTFNGLVLSINKQELHSRMMGNFNAYNILSVYGIASILNQNPTEVLRVLSNLTGAEGRFDWVKSKQQNIIGIVDYAHTPDALKNVLDTIRKVRSNSEKIITIFGCGGDRDHGKRPEMGAIAAELSDQVIITTDNSRSEEPLDIISDIKKGIGVSLSAKILTQVDRKEAIRLGVALANPQDIILLAGKGHEKYQDIKGVKHPFDDKAILQETFLEMNK